MFRKTIENKQGQNFIATVVLLIGVMVAIAIGAIVLYNFLSGTEGAYDLQEDFDVVNYQTTETLTLSASPDSATVEVDVYNSSAASWSSVSSALVSVSEKVVTVNNSAMDINSTILRVDYSMYGHDTNDDIVTYAVIVFSLAVIIPLIIVGGIMLKSLGFFSGPNV